MAVLEVHKVVGGQVTYILTDRNRAIEQCEQAIVFIGDATKPTETKKSTSNGGTAKYEDIRK